MLLFSGLFKLLFIAGIIYVIFVVVRLFQGIGHGNRPPSSSDRRPKSIQGAMVKDEVCNTYISKDEAIREIVQGKERFFCSRECRDKFFRKT
jgi:uncharacterized protein